MKPIQDASQIVGEDNCIQTTNPSNSKTVNDSSDLAEIEQIVKEKMVSSQKRLLLRHEINVTTFINRKSMKLV